VNVKRLQSFKDQSAG